MRKVILFQDIYYHPKKNNQTLLIPVEDVIVKYSCFFSLKRQTYSFTTLSFTLKQYIYKSMFFSQVYLMIITIETSSDYYALVV